MKSKRLFAFSKSLSQAQMEIIIIKPQLPEQILCLKFFNTVGKLIAENVGSSWDILTRALSDPLSLEGEAIR